MGADDEYVVSGSDDGHVYIWSKATAALLWWSRGDDDGARGHGRTLRVGGRALLCSRCLC